MEEVGVEVGDVEFAGSQPWPFPSSLMLGFYGTALTDEITVDHAEIAEARWFTKAEITSSPRRRAAPAADRVDLTLAGRELARRRDQRPLVNAFAIERASNFIIRSWPDRLTRNPLK